MGYLKCTECGRTLYSNNYQQVGLKCGVGSCSGILGFAGGHDVYVPKGAKLDLQCRKCFHICSSTITKLKIFDRCPIKGCNGTLDRFYS